MSNLIPQEFGPPVTPPKTQDAADDLDVTRIAAMVDHFINHLQGRGIEEVSYVRALTIAVAPEIARKVFTDGN